MRKITLGLAILITGFSFNTVVASWGQSPCYVTVPCYEKGFTFGLTGFYARPQNDNLTYAITYPATPENLDNLNFLKGGQIQSTTPDYDWGYRVSLGYIFPCTANDLVITYSNFDHHTQDNAIYSDTILFATISSNTAFFPFDYSKLTTLSGVTFDYQALDIDFGQHFNIGCSTHVKLFAGVRFADVERKFGVAYVAESVDNIRNFQSEINSRFRGAGPRVGTELQYCLGRSFGIVGQATGSLLMGDIRASFLGRDVITSADDVTIFDDFRTFRNPDYHKFVPNLTGKLGLNYNYDFCNCTHTKLTLEAGYQLDHYFDVVYYFDTSSAFTGNKQVSNISFSGPYVSVQVKL